MSGASIWERFTLDPRHPHNAHLRASDRDRDVVHEVLGEAYADGRLTSEEHDQRSTDVARTRTLGELPRFLVDLVAHTPARLSSSQDLHAQAVRRYRMQRQQALFSFLVPTLICWAVYLSFQHGETPPWPLIVTIATSIRLLKLVTTRADTIASLEEGLRRREERRVASSSRRRRPLLPPPQPPPPPGPRSPA